MTGRKNRFGFSVHFDATTGKSEVLSRGRELGGLTRLGINVGQLFRSLQSSSKKEMNRSFLQMMQHYKLPKVSHNGGTLYLHNHKLFCSGFGSTLEDAGNLASENGCEYIPTLQQKSIRPLIFFPPFFIVCYSV